MAFKYLILLACVSSVALAQQQQQGARSDLFNFDFGAEDSVSSTTPVPILRFIDTQNPDGSYTYGYESGDGTYKIETRFANGEVKGKYGYYDDTGKFRQVEYGAHTSGFLPTGEGLASPAVQRDATPQQLPEQPALTRPAKKAERRAVRRPASKPEGSRFAHFDRVSLPSQRQTSSRSIQQQRRPAASPNKRPIRRRVVKRPRTTTRPATVASPTPRQRASLPTRRVQPLAEQPRRQLFSPVQAAQPAFDAFGGHPAQNIDLSTGSFSVYYSG